MPLSSAVAARRVEQSAGVASDATERSVFEALVRELYVPLCRTALRVTGSYDVAEDVVVDVLVAFWNRDRSRAIGSERGYLYRAVRNRALRAIRSDSRARTVSLDEAKSVADAGGSTRPGECVDDLERVVDDIVASLPKRCRLVYILSREDRLTHAEIANILGISVKTVDAQLCRALLQLRRGLAPYLAENCR